MGTVGVMHRYAALLRGIAPSGRNMTNDKLRAVFDRLGFEKVTSVLASGNILFAAMDADVPTLERRIEDALTSDLGLASRTIIRPHAVLRTMLDSDPFAGLSHGQSTYLTATFLKDAEPDPERLPVRPGELTRVVRYDPAARVVLAVTDSSGPGTTPDFMVWLEKSFGRDITTRSWLTVQRIVRKLES